MLENYNYQRDGRVTGSGHILSHELVTARLVESVVFLLPDCATVNRFQIFLPSITTLLFRSTRNKRGNFKPILANAVNLYRILQLVVFV
jgi:hypothetical protein